MQNSTSANTACLDVTRQMNSVWRKHLPEALRGRQMPVESAEEQSVLLCSDIICVDDVVRGEPDFNITAYVMGQAVSHTRRFCREYGVLVRAFRSVEVLRMLEPGMPVSFLFLFEALVAS